MTTERGKLVVIEGTDGSGKKTQLDYLKERLEQSGIPFEIIDFPRYGENLYAVLAGRYLSGEFGSLYEVSPYLAALPFAGDRFLASPLIEAWLEEGRLVIANRYTTANKAHMTAKLPAERREEFIEWLDSLEYETNRIPQEDLVLLLYAPAEITDQNVEKKGAREYLGGEGKDIHEQDVAYQGETGRVFLWLAERENWVVINCVGDGEMRPREEIHQEIINALVERGIIK